MISRNTFFLHSPGTRPQAGGGRQFQGNLRARFTIAEVKQRTKCKACGQVGHWHKDPECPKRQQGSKEAHHLERISETEEAYFVGDLEKSEEQNDDYTEKANLPDHEAQRGVSSGKVHFAMPSDVESLIFDQGPLGSVGPETKEYYVPSSSSWIGSYTMCYFLEFRETSLLEGGRRHMMEHAPHLIQGVNALP